jgi:hypothetical protein
MKLLLLLGLALISGNLLFAVDVSVERDAASPPLLTLMALRSAGYDTDGEAPLEQHIEAVEVSEQCFVSLLPLGNETWKSFLARAYGSDISTNVAIGLAILSNDSVSADIKLNDLILPEGTDPLLIKVPSRKIIGDLRQFVSDLIAFTGVWFNQNLESGSFSTLERLYIVLHDRLLPYIFPVGTKASVEAENPLKQYVFDFKIISLMKEINDNLYTLISGGTMSWEAGWVVRDNIIAIQQQMAMALDDIHLVVKDGLRNRFEVYESRFRSYLDREILDRQRKLVTALSGNHIEEARKLVQSILYELKPSISGIVSSHREKALYDELTLIYKEYISPYTRERSLAFANHSSRIASLLAPPSKSDNYKMGFKISDIEYQFLKQSHSILLHTDCSGFIGRIYRELACIAGLDMSKFIVSGSGVIGTVFLIDPKVSVSVPLDSGENPCKDMLQGDYFYFERNIRGERQRHVVFFDRLIRDKEKGLMMSLWEASPGGVKHRIKPVDWVLKWVRSSYGAPRSGVYRLKNMDKIDSILQRRGLTA